MSEVSPAVPPKTKPSSALSSDPVLREAMDKIKAIVNEYDICAEILLVSENSGEFLFKPEATWNYTTVEPTEDKEQMRIRFKINPAHSREMMDRKLTASAHVLVTMAQRADHVLTSSTHMLGVLQEKVEILFQNEKIPNKRDLMN